MQSFIVRYFNAHEKASTMIAQESIEENTNDKMFVM